MTLTTPRLTLTPFADDHIDALLALFRDPHVRRYLLDDTLVDRAWVADEVHAREMARAVIDLAFTRPGFSEIRARTDAPNHASARVLAHLGMKLVATAPGEPWPQLHVVLERRGA